MSETYNTAANLKIAFEEMERAVFTKLPDGTLAKKTASTNYSGLLGGVNYDEVNVQYPTPTKEIFIFSLASAPVATIELTYTDASKNFLLKAIKL